MEKTINGTLSNGFKFSIPEERIGKWKMLKLLKETKKDPTLITEVVYGLLGDQEDAFIDSLGGDPDIEDVSKGITEIFEIAKQSGDPDAKKSSTLPA